eukprot:361440-Chlamydomonas_euryale.AAC.8
MQCRRAVRRPAAGLPCVGCESNNNKRAVSWTHSRSAHVSSGLAGVALIIMWNTPYNKNNNITTPHIGSIPRIERTCETCVSRLPRPVDC